ncbi:LOW QUALITY PROTEIN: neuronal acetylcholine receptor subunit alpha-10-like [Amphiura filiformis]|uniref:LOW QUALITY PROTEIN: neuronal acetylcholine receptor subunit alpha-10-like n=1 Tax=Amphiura filiformis TaxID=82378 RepID=UPI003B20DAD2
MNHPRIVLNVVSNGLLFISLFNVVKSQPTISEIMPPNNTSNGSTVNHMLLLRDNLFDAYGSVYVRPVRDGKSTTLVTFRMLLHSLLDMDTKNQRFKISTWVKMTWRDEFLQWNASEYGGIDVIHVPAASVWRPDITLHSNTEDTFELLKPDTYVELRPEGAVLWYIPTIYGSTCLQRVRYFPFDRQECTIVFSSWAYDGAALELQAETGADAEQIRYAENGVWSFISVTNEVITEYFPCCPEPYYHLEFTIVFQRNADFMDLYMILPCCFLSALSLLVFLLPPDCGEKLTLSITNLLALVVFQQLIAETMPPNGDELPLLGTYFLAMIIMVCVSVVATVLVISISHNSTQMHPWIKTLFLDVLSKVVCLTVDMDTVGSEPAPHKMTNGSTSFDEGNLNSGYNELSASVTNTGNGISSMTSMDPNIAKILGIMKFMKNEMVSQSDKENRQLLWKQVSKVIDRCLFLILVIFALAISFTIGIYIYMGSETVHNEH